MGTETTFYRFYSEIRSFLSKLMKNPIKATPSKYLKERDFSKSKLISILMRKGILERHEEIKDQTDSEYKKPTYIVHYKVKKKDFEKRIHRIYSKYFEKNVNDNSKKEVNEDGATGCSTIGSFNNVDVPLFGGTPLRRNINESETKRRVLFTEEQFKLIQNTINDVNAADVDEATTTFNIGSCGNYTANGLVLKTKNGKKDPSYNR